MWVLKYTCLLLASTWLFPSTPVGAMVVSRFASGEYTVEERATESSLLENMDFCQFGQTMLPDLYNLGCITILGMYAGFRYWMQLG